jgi:hypothetical protein
MNNSELYNSIISKENIYKAIYSLESYVFEKELLNPENIEIYIQLTDKYNVDYIDSVILKCIQQIERLFETDELFSVNVFFKPKKIDKISQRVEFRPIHTADIITQICIVSLLNVIMFDDSDNKRKLSDISKLLPSNFYGNIPSTNIDYLFEPWFKKYQKYSSDAIEAQKEYFKSRKYENEVNLDLKQFFPSIDPEYIYNYILSKWPITASEEDIQCLKILLEKLLFFKLEIPEEWLSMYYPPEMLKKISRKVMLLNIGIPQGLPQAYFFGNICMLDIAKEIKKEFKGDAYYYVDDSVIYTTFEKEEAVFFQTIKNLNISINDKISSTKKHFVQNIHIREFTDLMLYKVEIHDQENGKSTISLINLEDNLYEFAKPASGLTFEMRAAMDEFEDTSLQEKIQAILKAIDHQLTACTSNNQVPRKNIKLLQRYKKFYTNRLNIIRQREDNEVNDIKIESFFSKYKLTIAPTESDFFDKLEDDVFDFECRLLIRQLEVNPRAQENIINVIEKFEKHFNPEVNRGSNHYFSTVLRSCIEYQNYKAKTYESLETRTAKTIESFNKVKREKKEIILATILKLFDNTYLDMYSDIENRISEFINDYRESKSYFSFVYQNSPEFVRKIANSLLSRLFNVRVNDSCDFLKYDSRSMCYFELRILMHVRLYGFNISQFISHANLVLSEIRQNQNLEKIDLSLLEVLPVFRRYVKGAEKVDDLILIHKYVNGIWKNGSKFLHFYTLHNEEHSLELIKNCTKITKTIDYLSIKSEDYYVLFLACYLHDISMVLYPNINKFTEDNIQSDLIYTQWKVELHKLIVDFSKVDYIPKTRIKQLILAFYDSVNTYFENDIRDNHHGLSSNFIKAQPDLAFIEKPIRRLVAEVSEAHCYNTKDVYKLKSKARDDIFNEKYLMIILRLADLLDMSKDRVSINVLRQNINNMSDISKYHWISHMAIDECQINSRFTTTFLKSSPAKGPNVKITETIQINIQMNTKLLNSSTGVNCKNLLCSLPKNENCLKIEIVSGSQCNGKKCNFTCKWITNKHKYLFDELIALKRYLERNANNIFNTEIEVYVNFDNTSTLPADYLDVIKERIDA